MAKLQSFYGGQPGQSFKISKIFINKVEMDKDLESGWSSPIGVGEYVFISYGNPGEAPLPGEQESEYTKRRNADIAKYGETFNSTLWVKLYEDEQAGTNSGFSYKLIASTAGHTPLMQVDYVIAPPETAPEVSEGQDSTVDAPLWVFTLPQEPEWSVSKDSVGQDPETETTVTFTKAWDDPNYDPASDDPLANIEFSFPRPVQWQQPTSTPKKPEEQIEVSLDEGWRKTGSAKNDNATLQFRIPQEPTWAVSKEDKNPESPITLNLNKNWTDPNYNPSTGTPVGTFQFGIPKAPVMEVGAVTPVEPAGDPSVTIRKAWETTSGDPHQYFDFTIPRASNWYYGTLLGQKSAGTYTITDPSLANVRVGDYYVNSTEGFIYRCTAKIDNTNTRTFVFQSKLAEATPTVRKLTDSTPYIQKDNVWKRNGVILNSHYADETEQTGWILDFTFPETSDFGVVTNFIGPDETGSSGKEITDAYTMTYTFDIPRGARVFSGREVISNGSTVVVTDAKSGDLYLNIDSGRLFKLSGDTWTEIAHLMGPTRFYDTPLVHPSTDNRLPTDAELSAWLDTQFPAPASPPPEVEIVKVDWYFNTNDLVSYWCVYTDSNTWLNTLMSGNIDHFMWGSF